MWAIAINPSAGHGKGISVGESVVQYLSDKKMQYQVFSAPTASSLRSELETFLSRESVEGVICVGGDGLAHLVLQIVVPRHIPFAILPAGTGNDIVRTLGWSLDDVTSQLDRITSTAPQPLISEMLILNGLLRFFPLALTLSLTSVQMCWRGQKDRNATTWLSL